MHRRTVLLVCGLLAAAMGLVCWQQGLFPVLSSSVLLGKQPEGFYLVSTSQLLKPWGQPIMIPGRPVDMALDSSRRLLAVLNTRNVSIHDPNTGATLSELKTSSTSYTGIAFRPGDRELWASETTRNGPDHIFIAAIDEKGNPGRTSEVRLKGHPVPTGIAFDKDGKTAYIALSSNNTVAAFNTESREIDREIPVGMAPFSVAYSAKYQRLYVANRGGRRPAAGDTLAPTSGAKVVSDAKTGTVSTGTISIIDLTTGKTSEIETGLAPAAIVLSPDEETIAVANGHSDSISLFEAKSLKRADLVIESIPEGTIGSQPVTAAFSKNGNRLYIGAAGTNAVVIADKSGSQWKVTGHLPTAWFPSAIAVTQSGDLRVLAIKGLGNTIGKDGSFNSRNFEGALLLLPNPENAQLPSGTREVRAANAPKFAPAGGVDPSTLPIRHVFLIVKENRTYDQVFSDLSKGNREPKYLMYGRDVSPNHHALAEKYVILDNFYTGGAISFDGHQWLMMGFVSDYVERAFAASPRGYAWNMSDALTVAPSGFFWQTGTRPIDVRIYGEFSIPARWDPSTQNAIDINEGDLLSWTEYWQLYKSGNWQNSVGSKSGVPALQPFTDARYPNNTMEIPDQLRADEFIREFNEFDAKGKVPQLSIITLNEDHTSGTNPKFPLPKAMVADNDLALGRVVEAISKSKAWKNSLILVVEDDAQNGLDHVDGRRTIALAIGPYVRRDALDSNHYNHTSMIRTIQDILRVTPKTRALKASRNMSSIFTAQADLSPYKTIVPGIALDTMNPPVHALKGRQLWAARESLEINWSEPDDVPQETLNKILWWDAKGWNTPYPQEGLR